MTKVKKKSIHRIASWCIEYKKIFSNRPIRNERTLEYYQLHTLAYISTSIFYTFMILRIVGIAGQGHFLYYVHEAANVVQ